MWMVKGRERTVRLLDGVRSPTAADLCGEPITHALCPHDPTAPSGLSVHHLPFQPRGREQRWRSRSALVSGGLLAAPGAIRHGLGTHRSAPERSSCGRRLAQRVPRLALPVRLPPRHRPLKRQCLDGHGSARCGSPRAIEAAPALRRGRRVVAALPERSLAHHGAYRAGYAHVRSGDLDPRSVHGEGDRALPGFGGTSGYPVATTRGRPGILVGERRHGGGTASYGVRCPGPPGVGGLHQQRNAHHRTGVAVQAGRSEGLRPVRAVRAARPAAPRQHGVGVPGHAHLPTVGARAPQRRQVGCAGGCELATAGLRPRTQHAGGEGLIVRGRLEHLAQPRSR